VTKGEDEEVEADRDAYQRYLVYADCDACGGLRLNPRRWRSRVAGQGIGDVAVNWELTELDAWLATIDGPVAEPLVRKMRAILSHLITIGVGTCRCTAGGHPSRAARASGSRWRASSTATRRG
jgi:excinuclease UvrABC ATPase subunit